MLETSLTLAGAAGSLCVSVFCLDRWYRGTGTSQRVRGWVTLGPVVGIWETVRPEGDGERRVEVLVYFGQSPSPPPARVPICNKAVVLDNL